MSESSRGLSLSIMFAALMISGSLVFFGLQMGDEAAGQLSNDVLADQIEEGIEAYIENANKEYADSQNKPKPSARVSGDYTDDDAVLGSPDAPITIVEFSDYECPFCSRFWDQTLPEIKSKYIDTGKVKLVYRDYPLDFHDDAYPAALFAECARDQGGDEVYFKIHDQIFDDMGSGKGFDADGLTALAAGLGVNEGKLASCIESDKYKDEIAQDMKDGQSAGITGTPGFLVNGVVVSGAQPFSAFESVIEEELAKI